jgi:hypothetical protein
MALERDSDKQNRNKLPFYPLFDRYKKKGTCNANGNYNNGDKTVTFVLKVTFISYQ